MAKVLPDEASDSTKTVFLMHPEETGLLAVPASILNVTTATFFQGKASKEILEELKRRIVRVVEANPWLGCRLKKVLDKNCESGKKPGKRVAMVYEGNPERETIVADHFKQYSVEEVKEASEKKGNKDPISAIDLHAYESGGSGSGSGAGYRSICKAVAKSGAFVKCGAVGKNEVHFLVTVVPSADGQRFALIVTASHIIADGYTYYEILNMLASGDPAAVKSLNPIRPARTSFSEGVKSAVGRHNYAFTGSAGYMCNMIGGLIRTDLFGKKVAVCANFIDKEKVARVKEAGKNEGSAKKVPFVSTNDVVTSAFCNLARINVLEMAINMRDRLGPHMPADANPPTKNDAGNLEWALYFRPSDYASPSMIRQAITQNPATGNKLGRGNIVHGAGAGTPEKSEETKLPGFWAAARKKMAILTNWSSNHDPEDKGFVFEGEGCTQELHLPIYSMVPVEFGIIFKPQPGRLGLIHYSLSGGRKKNKKKKKKKKKKKNGQGEEEGESSTDVFGESVSDRVFGSW